MICTDGFAPFTFRKRGCCVFANSSLCGAEATLSYLADPMCSIFCAHVRTSLQALCWSRRHPQDCHFTSLFFSLTLCTFFLCALPSHTLWFILQELSFLSIRLQWISDYSFLLGMTLPINWPDKVRCSCDLQFYVVFLFLPIIFTHLLTRNFCTHRSPHYPLRNLFVLVTLVVSSFIFAAMDKVFCCTLSGIGRCWNPSCSAYGHPIQDFSHLVLHCPVTDSTPLALWRLLFSIRSLVSALSSWPASGAPWFSAMPQSLKGVR